MEKTIKIGDETIAVKTLTAEQIADLLDHLDDKRKATLAEMLMDSDIPEDFVIASSGLSSEWFKGPVTPDDISQVWEAFKETNSFLSRMLGHLSAVAKLLLKNEPQALEQPSAG